MKIKTPGLYDIPISDYHGQPCDGPSFSKSGLRLIVDECPAIYWSSSPLNPARAPKAETASQRQGKIIGAWVLGDQAFARDFVLSPFDDFRSGEAKAWKAEQTKTIVTQADLETAKAMKAALLADPDVSYAFREDHVVEQTIAWKEQHTGCGLWCLSRPDMIPASRDGLIKDYKRHYTINPDKLQYFWGDFGGDMQAAMALDGWRDVTGEKRPGFANIVQMPDPPYLAEMPIFDPEQIEGGRKRYLRALELAADCLESGRWPKYHQGPFHYQTPKSYKDKMEKIDASEQPRGIGSRARISGEDALAAC